MFNPLIPPLNPNEVSIYRWISHLFDETYPKKQRNPIGIWPRLGLGQ
jgi:hypothetical protein